TPHGVSLTRPGYVTPPRDSASLIADLQRQLQTSTAEAAMLRNMVAGAPSLFSGSAGVGEVPADILESIGENEDLMRGWNSRLRMRVRQLEEELGRGGASESGRSRTSSVSGRASPAVGVTIAVQTDRGTPGVDGDGELEALRRRTREQELTIKSLSELNAELRIGMIELESRRSVSRGRVRGDGDGGFGADGDAAAGTGATPTRTIVDPSADADLVVSLRHQCDSLTAELESLLEQRDADMTVFASKEQELVRSSQQHQARCRELEVQCKAACDRRDLLQREVNNLKAAKKSSNTTQVMSENLGRKVEALTRRLEASNKENREIAHENREIRAKLEAAERDPALKRLEVELEAARASVEALGAEAARLQSELNDARADGGASGWREERLRFQEELGRLRDAVVARGGNEGKLRVEVEEMKGRIEAVESEREMLRSDKLKLVREVEHLRSEKSHLVERGGELEKRVIMLEKSANEEAEAWRKSLREENDSLKEERIRLTRELELFKARHVELEGKVKVLKQELEETAAGATEALEDGARRTDAAMAAKLREAEMSLLAAREEAAEAARRAGELEAEVRVVNSRKQEAEAERDEARARSGAAEADNSRNLTRASRAELECEALRSQVSALRAVVAQRSATMPGGMPATSPPGEVDAAADTIARLTTLLEERTVELDALRDERERARATRLAELEEHRLRIAECEREVGRVTEQLRREAGTWSMRERTLYLEIERMQTEYHVMAEEMASVRRMIAANTSTARGAGPAPTEADVSVEQWARSMMEAYRKQQAELVEAHAIMDLQHEKLEDAIARSSMSVDGRDRPSTPLVHLNGRPASNADPDSGNGNVSTQTDPLMTLDVDLLRASLSASPASATPASSRDTSVPAQPGRGTAASSSDAGMSWDQAGASEREEKLAQHLTKLTARHADLQQKAAILRSQLDHQLRANAEIKRLIVGASVGGGGGGSVAGGGSLSRLPSFRSSRAASNAELGEEGGGELLGRYNDALVEIGSLRGEVERWRLRCEEVELVVESVVMRGVKALEEEEGGGEVSKGDALVRAIARGRRRTSADGMGETREEENVDEGVKDHGGG
ncbi:hypothetical protein HK101_000183, partial [Irineochytrium annulatum]